MGASIVRAVEKQTSPNVMIMKGNYLYQHLNRLRIIFLFARELSTGLASL